MGTAVDDLTYYGMDCMRILYLDSNHISRLARSAHEPDCVAVRDLLARGDVRLAMTWMHLQDLSAPAFRSRPLVGQLLDTLPIAWGITPDVLFDREVLAAIDRTQTGDVEDVRAFHTSFVHAFDAPPEADIPISEMLEALANTARLRSHLESVAQHSADMDARFKMAAAVVQRPAEPILAAIRDHNVRATPAGIVLPRRLTPEEVFERAGGLNGFPSINVAHSLARTRLRDESFPTDSNVQIDEWHACYAPYVTALALDRGTAARFRAAKLPCAKQVTHRLREIPALFAGN